MKIHSKTVDMSLRKRKNLATKMLYHSSNFETLVLYSDLRLFWDHHTKLRFSSIRDATHKCIVRSEFIHRML